MTIRHCVLLKFRADVSDAERQGIYQQLAALRGHLQITAMSFGANVSPEGLHLHLGPAHSLAVHLAAARDAYLVDAAHKAAGGRLVAALEGGLSGLIVFDIVV